MSTIKKAFNTKRLMFRFDGSRTSDAVHILNYAMLFSTDMHILVTSDADMVRRVVIHLLKELGYWKISEASSANMALRSFRNALSVRSPIDVLISALSADDKTSVELITNVRKIKILSTTPILLIAQQATKKSIAEAVQAGADTCIVPPFRAMRLQQKLEELGDKYAAASALHHQSASKNVNVNKLHDPIIASDRLNAATDSAVRR